MVITNWRRWLLVIQAVATALVFIEQGFSVVAVALLVWVCLTAYLVLVHDAR